MLRYSQTTPAIDLGKARAFAGFGWPLHLEPMLTARQDRSRLDRPCVDDLAAGCLRRRADEIAFGNEAGFLVEFAPGAASRSSPESRAPWDVQAPSSFRAQNGPPGWTRKTSIFGPERDTQKSGADLCGIGDEAFKRPATPLRAIVHGQARGLRLQNTRANAKRSGG